MTLIASAPGKLVLLGEYAVLEGAPALVAAVARRARVRIGHGAGDLLEVHAPELGVARARARSDRAGHLAWLPEAVGAERLQLVEAVWQALAHGGLTPPHQGLRIDLDTSGFFDAAGRGKLGLGSSAALCVALASALAAAAGQAQALDDRAAWRRRLVDLHGAWQGGQGSGLDVAASLQGGLVLYRREGASADSCAWPPAGASCLFIWSGQSVSTRGFLQRLATWRRAQPAAYAARMGELGSISEAACGALQGKPGAFVSLVDAYAQALRALARDSGLEIYSPAQQRAAVWAAREGAAYKPCGAGGDFGVVVADTPARLERVRRSMIDDGLQPVALAVDPHGLQFEGSFTQSGPPPIDAADRGRGPT